MTTTLISPSADTSGNTDATNMQNAATAGNLIELVPGGQYYLKRRVWFTNDGTGFFCNGVCFVTMVTSSGGFDLAVIPSGTYFGGAGTPYGSNHVAFLWYNSSARLRGGQGRGAIVTMQTQAAVRTCIPFAAFNVDFGEWDLEASNFQETYRGHFTCGGLADCKVRMYGHDLNMNSTSLASFQATVVEVDNDVLGGVFSKRCHFDVLFNNFVPGAAALAVYGCQTDALNIQTRGDAYHTFAINGDLVGEALDIFGDHCQGTINVTNVHIYALKMIYGARHNQIDLNVRSTGLGCIYTTGYNSGPPANVTQSSSNNDIRVNALDVCGLYDSLTYLHIPAQPGVYFDGVGTTYQPTNNSVIGAVHGNSGLDMPYVVNSGDGSGNTFDVDGSNFATAFGATSPATSNASWAAIGRKRRSRIKAYRSTSSATVANGVRVSFDTKAYDDCAELDVITNPGRFTCLNPGNYLFIANMRVTIAAGLAYGGQFWLNGGALIGKAYFQNVTANPVTLDITVQAAERLNAGEYVELVAASSGAAQTVIGGAKSETSLTILEQAAG